MTRLSTRIERLEEHLAVLRKIMPVSYMPEGQMLMGGSDQQVHVADVRMFGRLLSESGYNEEEAAKQQDAIGEALAAILSAAPSLLKIAASKPEGE